MGKRTTAERFWSKVGKTETCWIWTGNIATTGYGRFGCNNKMFKAHRYAYKLLVGPIPKGRMLDHLCRVRHCVNPAHLEPVTNGENILRGESWTAVNARKTHCNRGHEYTEENTYRPPGNTYRRCKKCRASQARHRDTGGGK